MCLIGYFDILLNSTFYHIFQEYYCRFVPLHRVTSKPLCNGSRSYIFQLLQFGTNVHHLEPTDLRLYRAT